MTLNRDSLVRPVTVPAGFAVKSAAKHGFPPLPCGDPGANHPGWIVTDMLCVAAGQVGNPISYFVPVKTDDRAWATLIRHDVLLSC